MTYAIWQYVIVAFAIGGAIVWIVLRTVSLFRRKGSDSPCCGCKLDDVCHRGDVKVTEDENRRAQACRTRRTSKH